MYVANSRKLISDVQNKMREMRNVEERLLPSRDITLTDKRSPLAMQLIWGDRQHLSTEVPDRWLKRVSSVRLDVKHEEETYRLVVNLGEGIYVPNDMDMYVAVPRTINPTEHPEVMQAIQSYKRYNELVERWGIVTKQVVDYLTSCKSLNEAIKLAPNIKAYIPEKYLDKVAEKAQKKSSDNTNALEKLEKMDKDLLAATAMRARMASSS